MRAEFTVQGEPKGKGRPRFSGAGGHATAYTPVATAEYENRVRFEYRKQCGNARFDDTAMLGLRVLAYFKIPKSASKKKRRQMTEHNIRPTKKPDMDNIIKIIADDLNDIAYHDDSQIVDTTVRKFYSDEPRVEVIIQEV